MAEDRELFRDLLDRIGQPYAPSCDRRGRDGRGARRGGPRGARRDRPAGDHPAGVHARRHRRRHRRDRGGLLGADPDRPARSAPSTRSWSSAAWSAGRRSSTRSCATRTTPASPSARWRTSTRSASTPATRSWSRRSRRCPTRSTSGSARAGARDHPGARRGGRLQRPVRALARLHRLRGHRGQPARQPIARRWRRRRPAIRSRAWRPRSRRAGGWRRSRTS